MFGQCVAVLNLALVPTCCQVLLSGGLSVNAAGLWVQTADAYLLDLSLRPRVWKKIKGLDTATETVGPKRTAEAGGEALVVTHSKATVMPAHMPCCRCTWS